MMVFNALGTRFHIVREIKKCYYNIYYYKLVDAGCVIIMTETRSSLAVCVYFSLKR